MISKRRVLSDIVKDNIRTIIEDVSNIDSLDSDNIEKPTMTNNCRPCIHRLHCITNEFKTSSGIVLYNKKLEGSHIIIYRCNMRGMWE